MPPKKSVPIAIQLETLQNHVEFLETTQDIDAAISHYEAAMAAARKLQLALDDRNQTIVKIKTTYGVQSNSNDYDTTTNSI